MIACVLIPDMVALVERQENPSLSGQHPVLLLNSSGKIQAASLDAMRQDVQLGMRLRQAKALCPDALVLPFNPTPYRLMSDALIEALSPFSNRIEVAAGFWQGRQKKRNQTSTMSAGVFYIDLGKFQDTTEALGLAEKITADMLHRFKAHPHIGLASNKFTAAVAVRYATRSRPKLVRPGHEAAFLAALPVSVLPLNTDMLRRLRLLGLHTLGQLAELPVGALASQFGKTGQLIAQLACGQDERSIGPLTPHPVECLAINLHGPVEDRCTLQTLLEMLGCDLEARLKVGMNTTQKLLLTLHLDDGQSLSEDLVLRKPTDDGRVLGRSLVRLFARIEIPYSVIGIEVQADDLHAVEWRQMDLFGQHFSTEDKLSLLLENLTLRFGENRFYRITLVDQNNRLVERRFQIDRVDAA